LAESSSGPIRDLKRKITPQGDFNGPKVASVVQRLIKEGTNQDCKVIEARPGSNEKLWFRLGKKVGDTKPIKPNTQASIKNKKALACNRASLSTQPGVAEGTKSTMSLLSSSSQDFRTLDGKTEVGSDGRQQQGVFQFSTLPRTEVGHQARRSEDWDIRSGVGKDQSNSDSVSK